MHCFQGGFVFSELVKGKAFHWLKEPLISSRFKLLLKRLSSFLLSFELSVVHESLCDGLDARVSIGKGLTSRGENNDTHLGIAERCQLARLLEQTRPPLREVRASEEKARERENARAFFARAEKWDRERDLQGSKKEYSRTDPRTCTRAAPRFHCSESRPARFSTTPLSPPPELASVTFSSALSRRPTRRRDWYIVCSIRLAESSCGHRLLYAEMATNRHLFVARLLLLFLLLPRSVLPPPRKTGCRT